MRCKALHFGALVLGMSFFANPTGALANGTSVAVPFRLAGNSILVDATVNGQPGHYLIDTGSPELMLNSSYFHGVAKPGERTTVVDFRGGGAPAKYLPVKTFSVGDVEMRRELALVTDLVPLESLKGTAIHGIIGHASLKHFELFFDFPNLTLTFHQIGKKGELPHHTYPEVPSMFFDLGVSGHLPYVSTKVGGKKVRFGIDTGAEVNLLNKSFYQKTHLTLMRPRSINIGGITGRVNERQQGILICSTIGLPSENGMRVTVSDIGPLNDALPIKLDGLLGVPFLKKGKCSINFKKKELCIWQPQVGMEMAIDEKVEEIEAKAGEGVPEK